MSNYPIANYPHPNKQAKGVEAGAGVGVGADPVAEECFLPNGNCAALPAVPARAPALVPGPTTMSR